MDDDVLERDDAVGAALAAQKRLGRALHRAYAPEWIHLDLTMGQLKTLMAIASRPPATISEIAATLEVGKPAASTLVEGLVQLGYAQRSEDPDDRRRALVTATQAGGDLVTRLRQGQGDRMARWLEAMEPADLLALTAGFEALAAIAERDTDTTTDPELTADTAAAS